MGSNVGCFRENACVDEVWVRVLGLLTHLRGKDFFKRLGNAFGGFVMVDLETKEKHDLK